MPTTWPYRIAAATFIIAIAAFSAQSAAQGGQTVAPQHFSGSTLYGTYCATCHGVNGKGDGPFATSLRSKPTDLTLLGKSRPSGFSREEVARIIDGRDPIKGHGGKDMPVWGDAFARTEDGPASVAEKIQSLVTYIQSIQEKS